MLVFIDRLVGVLAQIPGTDLALNAAQREGYEAVLVVIVVIVLLSVVVSVTGLGIRWMLKRLERELLDSKDREERLVKRIDTLEDRQTKELVLVTERYASLTEKVIDAMEKLANGISSIPYYCPNSKGQETQINNKV